MLNSTDVIDYRNTKWSNLLLFEPATNRTTKILKGNEGQDVFCL
jgi:hypothetical protein